MTTTPEIEPRLLAIEDIANVIRLLAIPTLAESPDRPVSNIVQPSLLQQLRANIQPDGDGMAGRRKPASERSPINIAALTEYRNLKHDIERLYTQGTDRAPVGSPEELLVAWYVELAIQHANGEIIQAQIDRLYARVDGWRTRIMDLQYPPERMEIPYACPECGWTRIFRDTPDGPISQYALVGIEREWRGEEGVICRAKGCGAEWIGRKPMLELAADLGIDITAILHPPAPKPTVVDQPETLWLCVMTHDQAKEFARTRELDPKRIVLASGPIGRLRKAAGPIRTATAPVYTPGPHEAARVREAQRVAQAVNALNGYDTEGNRVEEPS